MLADRTFPELRTTIRSFSAPSGLDLAEFGPSRKGRKATLRDEAGEPAAGNSSGQPGGDLRCIYRLSADGSRLPGGGHTEQKQE